MHEVTMDMQLKQFWDVLLEKEVNTYANRSLTAEAKMGLFEQIVLKVKDRAERYTAYREKVADLTEQDFRTVGSSCEGEKILFKYNCPDIGTDDAMADLTIQPTRYGCTVKTHRNASGTDAYYPYRGDKEYAIWVGTEESLRHSDNRFCMYSFRANRFDLFLALVLDFVDNTIALCNAILASADEQRAKLKEQFKLIAREQNRVTMYRHSINPSAVAQSCGNLEIDIERVQAYLFEGVYYVLGEDNTELPVPKNCIDTLMGSELLMFSFREMEEVYTAKYLQHLLTKGTK